MLLSSIIFLKFNLQYALQVMILRVFKKCDSKKFPLFQKGLTQEDSERAQEANPRGRESSLLVEAGWVGC